MTSTSPENRVLLVEDDLDLRASLANYLSMSGFEITETGSCLESYAALTRSNFNVAVVDVSLPDQSGLVLAEYLRTNTDLKIIILTALERIEDRVRGYSAGAHNYFVKPVDARELLAAIISLSHRDQPSQESRCSEVAPAQTWQLQRSAWRLQPPTGDSILLTALELQLMELLALNPCRVISRETLLSGIYGRSDEHSGRALDSLIRRLRAKIVAGGQTAPIKTAHAVGYCFTSPITVS